LVSLQLHLVQQDEAHGNSLPEESNGVLDALDLMHLSYLNSPMEPSGDIDKSRMGNS
jgi:hypothetical protein